jgi:hypothetical protein
MIFVNINKSNYVNKLLCFNGKSHILYKTIKWSGISHLSIIKTMRTYYTQNKFKFRDLWAFFINVNWQKKVGTHRIEPGILPLLNHDFTPLAIAPGGGRCHYLYLQWRQNFQSLYFGNKAYWTKTRNCCLIIFNLIFVDPIFVGIPNPSLMDSPY